MKTEKEKLEIAIGTLIKNKKVPDNSFLPQIGITLGSGLGYMVRLLKNAVSCPYGDIPFCPVSGATGHAGKLWFGYLNGVPVVMMQGRVHFYEGYDINQVVFPTRLMVVLGAKKLVLTHAVGAVTKNLEPTDIIGIRSHIALNCPDPTAGPNVTDLGSEFTPMGEAYSERLLRLAKECALRAKVSFRLGVSHFKQGRTYETPAEIEAMRRNGADVATMSTIPEVIAAVHMGAEVLDLALVTNMGAGLGTNVPLSHEEVERTARQMKRKFGRLVRMIVEKMPKD